MKRFVKKRMAAYIQQMFDVYVFDLKWDEKLYGKEIDVSNEIAKYSEKILNKKTEKERLLDWYNPVDEINPLSAIQSCQKENYWWDIQLRERYKMISIFFIVLVVGIIIAMGVCMDESINVLLRRLAFIAPMIKWLLQTCKLINRDMKRLKKLELGLNSQTASTLRGINDNQQLIFEHRKECFDIPNFFYEHFREKDEEKIRKINVLKTKK